MSIQLECGEKIDFSWSVNVLRHKELKLDWIYGLEYQNVRLRKINFMLMKLGLVRFLAGK